MDANPNSLRKKSVNAKLNQSYSSSSLLALNKNDDDLMMSVKSSFKAFDCGMVSHNSKKCLKRILPPIQYKVNVVKLRADGGISRRNNSDDKIKSKPTKSLGKLGSLSFSTSANYLNKGVELPKILSELRDDSLLDDFQRQSSKPNGLFTPTFRNMECDEEESNTLIKVNSYIHKKVVSSSIFYEQNKTKYTPVKGLIKLNSHFVSGLNNLNKVLKEPLPVCKSVKKIKVLEHKFPKDMFF